jgi:hypothetical protein
MAPKYTATEMIISSMAQSFYWLRCKVIAGLRQNAAQEEKWFGILLPISHWRRRTPAKRGMEVIEDEVFTGFTW